MTKHELLNIYRLMWILILKSSENYKIVDTNKFF